MPPVSVHRMCRALLVLALASAAAPPAHALRFVDHNLLNYPGSSVTTRNPYYRTVYAPIGAQVLVCEEVTSQAGVDSFRTNVLNVLEPGQWSSAPFVDGNDTDCALFYKPAVVQYLGQWAFYPNPASLLRLVHVYRLKPVGYDSETAELRVYALHLKASTGFESQRLAEATGLRDSMNAMPPGTHAIACGDFNLYKGTEPALGKLLESQTSNVGRLYDPLGLQSVSWQDNSNMSIWHTQSPCLSGCLNGGASGGLDDRFDLILPTLNMGTGQGLSLVPGSYKSIANDGLHLNKNLTDAPTIPEGAAYATALWSTSDHLPVRVDLQLPARIGPVGPLAFGAVIVGAPAPTQTLTIADVATVPAEALSYSFTVDAGFEVPAGNFAVAAGQPGALQSVTMDTSTPALRSGQLHIVSNDLDHPTTDVALSGTVLGHAVASLDSIAPRDTLTVDFGYRESGQFTAQEVRVHNAGWNALQARLAVSGATLAGGNGRFSIVGGFSAVQLREVGQTWSVVFDDAGATPDSTYQATLTFASADEDLPGAQPQPDLTVTLLATAKPSGPPAGLPVPPPPSATRLYAPVPNPLVGASTVRFDLARADEVTLAAFDASGRRVATLLQGRLDAGRYSVRWNGQDASGGPATPGLYFVRLSGREAGQRTVRLALLR